MFGVYEYWDCIKDKNDSIDLLCERVGILMGILNGLEHIHSVGLIHGDIKIDNVVLIDNMPLMIDFGKSKFIDKIAIESKNGIVYEIHKDLFSFVLLYYVLMVKNSQVNKDNAGAIFTPERGIKDIRKTLENLTVFKRSTASFCFYCTNPNLNDRYNVSQARVWLRREHNRLKNCRRKARKAAELAIESKIDDDINMSMPNNNNNGDKNDKKCRSGKKKATQNKSTRHRNRSPKKGSKSKNCKTKRKTKNSR